MVWWCDGGLVCLPWIQLTPFNLFSPSALRTLLEVSTECSTGGEDTCSRRHRPPAPPCSSSRLTCLSTSPSASPPTCAPTPEARPSHSASSTTGRSCPEIPSATEPDLSGWGSWYQSYFGVFVILIFHTFLTSRPSDCRGHQEEEGVEARPCPARQLLGQNVTSLAILRILNWEGCFYSLRPRNLVKFSYIGKNFDIFGSIGRMDITPVC